MGFERGEGELLRKFRIGTAILAMILAVLALAANILGLASVDASALGTIALGLCIVALIALYVEKRMPR